MTAESEDQQGVGKRPLPGVAAGEQTDDHLFDLERLLAHDEIADALRWDIVFGRIPPGTRLSQSQLSRRFGTSRLRVRDGLRTLQHEGWLLTDRTRRPTVARPSRDEILDAFIAEAALFSLAAPARLTASDP
jgi:DNA-binding GntR family transcriptional regulator